MAERVIFHVDANSAFLSWSAAYRVKVLGETEDLMAGTVKLHTVIRVKQIGQGKIHQQENTHIVGEHFNLGEFDAGGKQNPNAKGKDKGNEHDDMRPLQSAAGGIHETCIGVR